jgi:hypothetical protein
MGEDSDSDSGAPHCWLCARPLGEVTELHLPIPKNRGGKVKVQVHPICHRTIHDNVSNAEMERRFNTPEALKAHEIIGRFVEWIANKPPDFDAPTKRGR